MESDNNRKAEREREKKNTTKIDFFLFRVDFFLVVVTFFFGFVLFQIIGYMYLYLLWLRCFCFDG